MNVDPQALRRHMARLPDEQLLDIVTIHRQRYRRLALDLAEAELQQRGLQTTLPVAVYQRGRLNRRPRTAVQTFARAADVGGLAFMFEIICAVLGCIALAALLVSGRETQKTILRWAGTSLVLPYVVWRGARYVNRRWQTGDGAQQGQATN